MVACPALHWADTARLVYFGSAIRDAVICLPAFSLWCVCRSTRASGNVAMARRSGAGKRRRAAGRRPRRSRWRVDGSAWARRWRQALALPLEVQLFAALAVLVLGWVLANGLYQVVRKPTELFFPVSGQLFKTPSQTWDTYHRIFQRHSTATMTPSLLAALAQVEASGNPVARTYWRFALTHRPFEIYRPASSAVGMYQITDGTFQQARRYCIHDHQVVQAGRWHDIHSCWFNSLYLRVIPSHAVEMTSAYLHTQVENLLRRHRITSATLLQRQQLATLIHLCGAGAGARHARRGLRLPPGLRCGDHSVAGYLSRVRRMQEQFERLAQRQTG